MTFDSVWHLHQQGAGTAQIVQAFDTLDPADVHAVLAWALRHRGEVDDYLKRRDTEAVALRHQMEEAGITPTEEESAKLKARVAAQRQELKLQRAGDATLSDG